MVTTPTAPSRPSLQQRRNAFLRALLEYPRSIGATPRQIREICRQTDYPNWGGTKNGSGLCELVPGTKNARLSPCGVWWASVELVEDASQRGTPGYSPLWVLEATKQWRKHTGR